MQQITVSNLDGIAAAAKQFVALMGTNKVFALFGPMGVGKTTFVRAVCQELGVQDTVTSPTFAIVNEYRTATARSVYHFDFYRIRKVEEVYDMGYEDYFYSGSVCFLEWPELVEELLPEDVVRVTLSEAEDGVRTISLS